MSETLSDVLHPEIILGRRGPEDVIAQYQGILPHLVFKGDHGWALLKKEFLEVPSSTINHFIMCKKFVSEKPVIYRLGKDFGSVLSGVENDVPMDKLPERFFAYISMPKGVLSDDTGNVLGAYIFIGNSLETSLRPTTKTGERILWVSVVGEATTSDGEYGFTTQHVCMGINGSFEELFKSLPQIDRLENGTIIPSKKAVNQRLAVLRCLINSVLYIHSLEPNIEHLRPARNLSHGDRRKLREAGGNVNLCSVPVVAINWAYKRERLYGVEETFRREHLRWQRCGQGLTDIKLITVKGHIVKFGKTIREAMNEQPTVGN